MALTKGTEILWSDITTVLTSVNAARRKMNISNTTVTGGIGTLAKQSTVQDLYDALLECGGKEFPFFEGTSLAGFKKVEVKEITIPSVGDLIKPLPLVEIDEEANHVKLSIKGIDYRVGNKNKKAKIKETGTGFEPLINNIEHWINEKLNEMKS